MFVSFGSRWDLNFCMLQELMERRGEIWSHFEAMPFTFKDAPRADGAKRRILDSFFLDSHRDSNFCMLLELMERRGDELVSR